MNKYSFSYGSFTVEVNDASDEVLEKLKTAKERGLEVVGKTARDHARNNLKERVKPGISKGNLEKAIDYEIRGNDVYIGVLTSVPYGIYVEFGTGVLGELGGRQTPWVYCDENGNFWTTKGQPPKRFLRDAAEGHEEEYSGLIRESFENA